MVGGATSGASSAATTMIFTNHQHISATVATGSQGEASVTQHARGSQSGYPIRTASPLSVALKQDSSLRDERDGEHGDGSSLSWDSSDYSSDEYDYDDDDDGEDDEDDEDYQVDSRRTRPAGPHLVIDTDTMRLPSGRIISSRGTSGGVVGSQHPRRRRPQQQQQQQQRWSSSQHLPQEEAGDEVSQDNHEHRPPGAAENSPSSRTQRASSQSASPEPSSALTTAPTERSPSKRETKGRRVLAAQLHAHLRPSDQQTLSRMSRPEQRALLAATRRDVEKAQREGRRFTSKMDGLGNIKVSERFVNDVPGGKAHKNRFFAR